MEGVLVKNVRICFTSTLCVLVKQVAVEEDNHVATAAFTLNTCLRN